VKSPIYPPDSTIDRYFGEPQPLREAGLAVLSRKVEGPSIAVHEADIGAHDRRIELLLVGVGFALAYSR